MIIILISGFLGIYVLLYYIRFYRRWWNGPPGPFPLPLIGNLGQLIAHGSKSPSLAIAGITSLYGDLYRLKIGVKDFVVMSSIDTIMKLSNRDEALGRDSHSGVFYERSCGKNSGIITSGGKTWETTRKWTFKTLNSLGMRKGSGIEAVINEQGNAVIKSWNAKLALEGNFSPVQIPISMDTFIRPVTNVVFKFVMGDRIYDPKHRAELDEQIEIGGEFARSIGSFAGSESAFPMLGLLFPRLTGRDLNLKCNRAMRKAAMGLLDEVRREINLSSEISDKKVNSTITHAYLEQMEKNPEDSFFSDFHFTSLYMDLFQASSETTASYLQSILLYLIAYPEIQSKIYDEICATIQENEVTVLDHQKRLPYTEAFMLETHRKSQTLTNLVPHRVTADFTYGDYLIPRNTVLIADMHSANNDTRIWKNPGEFDPTRFLDSEGQLRMEMKRKCLPFGTGRRMCPGESVAEWTAFLFMINILRNFKLSLVPGENPPRKDMNAGVTSAPYPFKIAISRRT